RTPCACGWASSPSPTPKTAEDGQGRRSRRPPRRRTKRVWLRRRPCERRPLLILVATTTVVPDRLPGSSQVGGLAWRRAGTVAGRGGAGGVSRPEGDVRVPRRPDGSPARLLV